MNILKQFGFFVCAFSLNLTSSEWDASGFGAMNSTFDKRGWSAMDEVVESYSEYGPRAESPCYYPARKWQFLYYFYSNSMSFWRKNPERVARSV